MKFTSEGEYLAYLDDVKQFLWTEIGLDHLVGHPENLVATSKSAEAHGITKPLRNQAFV